MTRSCLASGDRVSTLATSDGDGFRSGRSREAKQAAVEAGTAGSGSAGRLGGGHLLRAFPWFAGEQRHELLENDVQRGFEVPREARPKEGPHVVAEVGIVPLSGEVLLELRASDRAALLRQVPLEAAR